jgi:hypothetical protein
MNDYLYSRAAPTKHRTAAAFQKLCSAKQRTAQTVTSFSAYIVTTCDGAYITGYNQHMFFWTGLRPEIRDAVRKGQDLLTFDACLEAGVEVETALCLNAEYNKAFKSAPKEPVVEKARKDKGKGKAHHDSGKDRSSQGTPQCSRGGFCSRGCSHGHNSHGQGGQQHQQGDRSGAQGARVSRRPSACKSCGTFGQWAQDCKMNPAEGSAASPSKQKS